MLYNKIIHNIVTAEVNNNINRIFANNGWDDELRDIFVDNIMIDIMTVGEVILANPYDFQIEALRQEGYTVEVDGEDDEVAYYRITGEGDKDEDETVANPHHGRKLRAPSREYTRTVNSLHPEMVPDRCSRRIKGIHNTRKHWKNEERRKLRHHNKDICKKVILA